MAGRGKGYERTDSEGVIRQGCRYMTERIGQEQDFASSGLQSYYMIMMMIPLLVGAVVTELRLGVGLTK
jgi:hypothetical protein